MEMGLSDGEIFARALKANSFHGRNLSVQERTAGFKRLREEFHFSTEDVQNILQTPIERLEHWNATRGIELKAEGAAAMLDASIFDSVRKAPLAEMNIPEGKLRAIQENIAARDQRQIFRSAVSIVESGLLDRSDLELLGLVERLGVAISKLKLKRKIPA